MIRVEFQGNACDATISADRAVCLVPVATAGIDQPLVARYLGDASLRPAQTEIRIDVGEQPDTIRILSARCATVAGEEVRVTINGTASGRVCAAILAMPTTTIGDPTKFSHSCSGWTGVVHYSGYTHCLGLPGDPPAVTWSTTSASLRARTSVFAELADTVNGQFASHFPPLLATDTRPAPSCPGSLSY